MCAVFQLSGAGTEREYKAALEKAGLQDIEAILVEMAEGPEPYIELEELTITNKTRLMVVDIYRPRLLRFRISTFCRCAPKDVNVNKPQHTIFALRCLSRHARLHTCLPLLRMWAESLLY